jgi:tetratricopeptide (TPR) repeat protein
MTMSIPIEESGSNYPVIRMSIKMLALLIILPCLFVADIALPSQANVSQADENRMIARIEAAEAEEDRTTALKYALDYSEKVYGENAPVTIRLMHRYGYSLYKDGRYREAINALKQTLERSTGIYGGSGGEAFEINMNLGNAYSQQNERWEPRLKHFDRALEILRERGEQESITYVATLVNIVINLLNSNSLSGDYSSHFNDTIQSEEAGEFAFHIESEYRNNFGKPEKYLLEAVEIGARLETLDPYISARIAVLQAKLNVLQTADLATLPGGVEGRITRGAARDKYDREQARLMTAIDRLAQDTETNRAFLEAANKILLDIAWLDKNEERLVAMCAAGTVNSAGDYPADHLYEIMEGGVVFAPEIGIRISKNIFRQVKLQGRQMTDERGNPAKKPYFKPVCVDGRLMAALIHAPRVTVEEIRQEIAPE